MLKHKYITGIIAMVLAIILGGCAAPADLPERTAKAGARGGVSRVGGTV